MNLLVFAHRAEARVFLKKMDFTPLPLPFEGAYERDKEFLIITGEGIQEATQKLSSICAVFYKKITSVINLGIAGTLDDSLCLEKIYTIRTCYGEDEFKSYSSFLPDDSSLMDCISSKRRVHEKIHAYHLSCFADLVDREAWAVGSVCSLFKIPFFCFKLASDRANASCSSVKENGDVFGRQLYEYYEGLTLPKREKTSVFYPGDEFYFTTAQKRIYQKLIVKLQLKYNKNQKNLLEDAGWSEIGKTHKTPKQRTSCLIDNLREILNSRQFRV